MLADPWAKQSKCITVCLSIYNQRIGWTILIIDCFLCGCHCPCRLIKWRSLVSFVVANDSYCLEGMSAPIFSTQFWWSLATSFPWIFSHPPSWHHGSVGTLPIIFIVRNDQCGAYLGFRNVLPTFPPEKTYDHDSNQKGNSSYRQTNNDSFRRVSGSCKRDWVKASTVTRTIHITRAEKLWRTTLSAFLPIILIFRFILTLLWLLFRDRAKKH